MSKIEIPKIIWVHESLSHALDKLPTGFAAPEYTKHVTLTSYLALKDEVEQLEKRLREIGPNVVILTCFFKKFGIWDVDTCQEVEVHESLSSACNQIDRYMENNTWKKKLIKYHMVTEPLKNIKPRVKIENEDPRGID